MADPIVIPLSPHQQAMFARWKAAEDSIVSQRNAAVTAIVAGTIDPATIQTHHIAVNPTDITLTPPPPSE